MVKNLPVVQETQVHPLDWEDPLEKEMATYSTILAWRIPWTEESSGRQFMSYKELDRTEQLTLSHNRMYSKVSADMSNTNYLVIHFKLMRHLRLYI